MQSKVQGFTLIELMVVISLLGVLAALAAPSFRDAIESRRLRGASTEMNAVINEWLAFARKQPQGGAFLTIDLTNACVGYIWSDTNTPTRCDCTATAPSANACSVAGTRLNSFRAADFPGVALAHVNNATVIPPINQRGEK